MSEEYEIGRLRGKLALVYFDANGTRHRHSLGTSDPSKAKQLAPALFAELTRPKGKSVAVLWGAYLKGNEGRHIVESMVWTRKALEARFWSMDGERVTSEDCDAHMAERRAAGRGEWTIYTELNHLSIVLSWAEKQSLIVKAPFIKRPPQPKPKEDKHLERDQVKTLIASASLPHVKLAIILLYTTAARSAALCGLKWVRCDFQRDRIDLRDPDITRPHKGRAIVPMLRTAKAALLEAQQGALTEYVIEWGGQRIKSLKKGIRTAAKAAQITKPVSPHILRHSAAVHMAEDGVDMEVIRQFLGHTSIETTRKIYARFSPTYLKDAAAALELDAPGSMNQRALPKSDVSA